MAAALAVPATFRFPLRRPTPIQFSHGWHVRRKVAPCRSDGPCALLLHENAEMCGPEAFCSAPPHHPGSGRLTLRDGATPQNVCPSPHGRAKERPSLPRRVVRAFPAVALGAVPGPVTRAAAAIALVKAAHFGCGGPEGRASGPLHHHTLAADLAAILILDGVLGERRGGVSRAPPHGCPGHPPPLPVGRGNPLATEEALRVSAEATLLSQAPRGSKARNCRGYGRLRAFYYVPAASCRNRGRV
ncbi:unnamed protein product [Ixodes pacificus]